MNKDEKEEFIESYAPMRTKEGLPDGPTPTSIPRAKPKSGLLAGVISEIECPVCGCEDIFEVEQDVEDSRLVGGKGIGVFLGCPACPWASSMLTIALAGSSVD